MVHVNHAFLLDFAHRTRPGGKILDYGCGAAETVRAGLGMGLDIYGTDAFYEGQADHRPALARDGLLNTRVFELSRDFKMPFPDKSFDFVFSNQVMEHVEHLDGLLNELTRVLKDDGVILSYFPLKDCLMEFHCETPFAHWFSHDSKLGYYWLYAWFKMGRGSNHKDKTAGQWAHDFQEWIHKWCHYRTRSQVAKEFAQGDLTFEPHELDYVRYRLNHHGKGWASSVFAISPALTTFLFTHFGGGVVATSRKLLRRERVSAPASSLPLPAVEKAMAASQSAMSSVPETSPR
jgi:SAM-dependent methyltransferase